MDPKGEDANKTDPKDVPKGMLRKTDGKLKWRGRRWSAEEQARNNATLASFRGPIVPVGPATPTTNVVKVDINKTTATPTTRTALQFVCGESRGRLRQRPDGEFEFSFNDLMGKRHRHEVGRDEAEAREKAESLVTTRERARLGLVDPLEQNILLPLAGHFEAFASYFRARVNAKRARRPKPDATSAKDARLREREAKKDEHYIKERIGFLDEFAKATNATKITDFSLEKVSSWLDGLKAEAKTARYGCPGLSARALNKRRQSLCAFTKWAVATRRLAWDPLALTTKYDEGLDKRHLRRDLTDEEFGKLLAAAIERPLAVKSKATRTRAKDGELRTPELSEETKEKLRRRGEENVIIYAYANRGGLRRSELEKLKKKHIDEKTGWTVFHAHEAKSRRDQESPIPEKLLVLLRERLAALGPDDFVFRVVPSIKQYRLDLAAAEIPYENEKGERADFHAARTKLATDIQDPEKGGGTPVDAGDVLRNDPAVALKHYTKKPPAQKARVKAIVDSLPLPLPPALEERVAKSLPKSTDAERSAKDLCDRSGTSAGAAQGPRDRQELVGSTTTSEYARQDSNLKPSAPEADALSN